MSSNSNGYLIPPSNGSSGSIPFKDTVTLANHRKWPKVKSPIAKPPARCTESKKLLTRSLREPGGPCTKAMEVSKSRMETG